jgi:hypothetical protein
MANYYQSTRNTEYLLLRIAQLLEKLSNETIQDGFFLPKESLDADAPINSIYFSLDTSVLTYKDSSNVTHDLY